jgi:hypothetical protein
MKRLLVTATAGVVLLAACASDAKPDTSPAPRTPSTPSPSLVPHPASTEPPGTAVFSGEWWPEGLAVEEAYLGSPVLEVGDRGKMKTGSRYAVLDYEKKVKRVPWLGFTPSPKVRHDRILLKACLGPRADIQTPNDIALYVVLVRENGAVIQNTVVGVSNEEMGPGDCFRAWLYYELRNKREDPLFVQFPASDGGYYAQVPYFWRVPGTPESVEPVLR